MAATVYLSTFYETCCRILLGPPRHLVPERQGHFVRPQEEVLIDEEAELSGAHPIGFRTKLGKRMATKK